MGSDCTLFDSGQPPLQNDRHDSINVKKDQKLGKLLVKMIEIREKLTKNHEKRQKIDQKLKKKVENQVKADLNYKKIGKRRMKICRNQEIITFNIIEKYYKKMDEKYRKFLKKMC